MVFRLIRIILSSNSVDGWLMECKASDLHNLLSEIYGFFSDSSLYSEPELDIHEQSYKALKTSVI